MDSMKTAPPLDDVPLDEEAVKEADARRAEYAERARFHQIETERYARMSRAESAKLAELQAISPQPDLDLEPHAELRGLAGSPR